MQKTVKKKEPGEFKYLSLDEQKHFKDSLEHNEELTKKLSKVYSK